jgi:uncharacterized protein
MKLHLTQSNGNNLITGYGVEHIDINHQRYTSNIIVMADATIISWTSSSQQLLNFDAITALDFKKIIELAPEVVLLGTGEKHRFLHPKIYMPLTEQGIALECMTTAAACRTYNILMSEGRKVAAALLLE